LPLLAIRYSLFARLLLLAGNRLGRPLARARVGVGPLTAHRQAAPMTQTSIAAKVHEALDVDAGLAAKVALDDIVAVDHFADLKHFLVAQLADPALFGNLHLLYDVGRDLGADAMDVLQRDQYALVGGNIDAGNTGHSLFSCRRTRLGAALFVAISGRCPQTRTRRPAPWFPGVRHRLENHPTWIGGL